MSDAPLQAAPTSDAERFLVLVERHTPLLLKVTSALVGFDDAEDAAQEAVLRAWQARATLRDPEALRAWLLRIAVNVCRQWQRGRYGTHRRLRTTLPTETSARLSGDLPLSALGADPGALSYAAALDLRQAINALDPDLRLAVILRYYAGMDASEIGAAVGAPAATIRTRLRRALFLLRQQLGEPEDGATQVTATQPPAPSVGGGPTDSGGSTAAGGARE